MNQDISCHSAELAGPEPDRLRRMLHAECSKPYPERDYDRIAQITDALFRLNPPDSPMISPSEAVSTVTARYRQFRRRRMRRVGTALTAVACIAVVFGCNLFSVRTYGINMVRAVYEVICGGVQFSLKERNMPQQEMPNPDPMQHTLETCGFTPLMPAYLPEDLTLIRTQTDETPFADFRFRNGAQTVELTFEQFSENRSPDDIMAGFPSDQYRIRETQSGGTEILISWEDKQFTAVFMQDQILYTVFTENLEYDEAYRILQSFFA